MAIDFDPVNRDAYVTLGKKLIDKAVHLFEHKEYEKARAAYAEAIQFDPSYERIYHSQFTSLVEKGTKLHKLKNYIEALELYEQAIQFNPSNALVYVEKGHSLYALQRFTDAFTAYTKATKLDPNYIEVLFDKVAPLIAQGEALCEHGDYEHALELYEQVLQFNPENTTAYSAKLKILYKLEQIGEAQRVAERLKKLNTKNSSWLSDEPFRYEL